MKRLSVFVSALALAASANATTITSSFSNALQDTEISQSGSLNLFDSSLGTLTGASITLNGAAQFIFQGSNGADQPQTASLTSSTSIIYNTTLSALQSLISASSVDLSHSSGFQTYGANQTLNFGPFNENGSTTANLGSILASLQGTGSFNLGCNSLSGFSVVGGGGQISTMQSTQAACGATITYTYEEPTQQVPEPGMLALFGLGAVGLGLGRLRRKA